MEIVLIYKQYSSQIYLNRSTTKNQGTLITCLFLVWGPEVHNHDPQKSILGPSCYVLRPLMKITYRILVLIRPIIYTVAQCLWLGQLHVRPALSVLCWQLGSCYYTVRQLLSVSSLELSSQQPASTLFISQTDKADCVTPENEK